MYVRLITAPPHLDGLMRELADLINERFSPAKSLVHYARDPETKAPFGTVVAKVVDGYVSIGWSLWADTNERQFKKDFQRRIAEGRADKGSLSAIPHELDDAINHMAQRAMKYYNVDMSRLCVAGVY